MTNVASGHIYAGLAGGGKKIQKDEVLLTGPCNDECHHCTTLAPPCHLLQSNPVIKMC